MSDTYINNKAIRQMLEDLGTQMEVSCRILDGRVNHAAAKREAEWWEGMAIAPWFRYGVWAIYRDGRVVEAGAGPRPLDEVEFRQILGVKFDRARVWPSDGWAKRWSSPKEWAKWLVWKLEASAISGAKATC